MYLDIIMCKTVLDYELILQVPSNSRIKEQESRKLYCFSRTCCLSHKVLLSTRWENSPGSDMVITGYHAHRQVNSYLPRR